MGFSINDERKEAIGLYSWICGTIFLTVPFLLLVTMFCPTALPFRFGQFFVFDKFWAGVFAGYPFYLWGMAITFVFTIFREERCSRKPGDIISQGFWTSLRAGIAEEIIFRWLYFFSAIIGVKVAAFFFFGWVNENWEIARLLHLYFFGPIVNFIMFNQLGWLFYDMGWAVGAAAIMTNAKFRREHAYLGNFGYYNSWVAGFFLFWIMFTYGLPAAIAVHFTYDFLLDLVRACLAAIQGGSREKPEKGDRPDDIGSPTGRDPWGPTSYAGRGLR
jgi:hypothetical protein